MRSVVTTHREQWLNEVVRQGASDKTRLVVWAVGSRRVRRTIFAESGIRQFYQGAGFTPRPRRQGLLRVRPRPAPYGCVDDDQRRTARAKASG